MFGYNCPNVRNESIGVYTNNPLVWFYRGVSQPQLQFAQEQLIDEIAETVGMNPLDYRLKHHLVDQNVEPIERAAETIEWRGRWTGPGTDTGIKKRGLGMCMSFYGPQGPDYIPSSEQASVRIQYDGSVILNTTYNNIGSGGPTCFQQMCAEELGIPFEGVIHEWGDSVYGPPCAGSWGSHETRALGRAVVEASLDAKRQLLQGAAEQLGVTVEELEINWEEAKVYVKTTPDTNLSFTSIVPSAWGYLHGELIGTGNANLTPEELETPTPTDLSTVQTEVEVDTETGQVEVLSMVIGFNIGKAINPLTLHNQLIGGCMQALRHGLTEREILDESTGKMLNPNFLEYKTTTMEDVPAFTNAIWNEHADPVGPYGAKGVGEAPLAFTDAAIANAIYNAIGVRFYELPVTPDKVLAALGKV